MQIGPRTAVTIEYTLRDDKGELLDTSEGGTPLSYLHGSGTLIPAVEKALDGKGVGEAIEVSMTAAEGYGERDEKLVQNLPLRKLSTKKAEIGKRYRIATPRGSQVGLVTAIHGDYATVDQNHPLAGRALSFVAKVVGVRAATDEELTHGHIHGPGGHHH